MKMHEEIKDPTGIVHPWVVDFELAFFNEQTLSSVHHWLRNWWWLSLLYALFYIIAVFVGQSWMNKKQTNFWGVCRCVPELIHALTQHGFMYSICDTTYMKGITGLWVFLFAVSKAPETIDTLFIVLRRQQLIFLHWYHHASVLVYCFYSYTSFASTGRWFVSMNFCVHTIMYGYFALRAARVNVPRFCQQFITILQLTQMVAGCIVNIYAYQYKQQGYLCSTSSTNIVLSLALYASYFALFAHFFYVTYVKKKSKKTN